MKAYAAKKRADGVDIYEKYRNRDYAIAHRAMRRARKYAADAESFLPSEVFERDQWLCGICLMPVDPGIAWPDPLSVSLDHIIPFAAGGSHTRANTQCSHLTCNTSKGARPDTMGRSPSK